MATEQVKRLAGLRGGVNELKEHVEKIWRKSRPKLMQLYDETGKTERRTKEAARNWLETTEDLEQQGLSYEQAYNFAMSEWVCLPDIEEDDDEEKLRS